MQNKITFLIIVLLINTYTKAQTIRYVSPTGLGNGTSWANAAPGSNLQSIINTAAIGDQIWVRCGSYSPTNTANRAISFSLRNGVSLYGGFDGTETVLSDRDISCFSCSILSGEIGAAGIADNSYHVISNPAGLNATALIDGFVIENANDNRTASSTAGLGGGIYNNGGNAGNICSPTIRNCVIRNNAAQFGAGIFNSGFSGGNSSPLIENCIIHNNNAYNGGGAIDNFGLGGNASPTLTNCIVYNNTATSRAGGMYNWGGNGGNASPSIINCTFANNSSTFGGALVSDNENSPGGTFSGNSNPILLNTIFWGNTATTMGPQFYIIGTATLSATYSCIDMSAQATPHILSGSTIGNRLVSN